jgi:methylmalonyl-CoA mutase cobalamin-binding subunit
VKAGVKPVGKMLLGTVKGDLHDIGKNLVKMMAQGAGIEVVDLGIDVSADKFIQGLKDNPDAKAIGMSALLTTTMTGMKEVIDRISKDGMRSKVRIMVGGAPLTDQYAREIGADGYAPDAASAAESFEVRPEQSSSPAAAQRRCRYRFPGRCSPRRNASAVAVVSPVAVRRIQYLSPMKTHRSSPRPGSVVMLPILAAAVLLLFSVLPFNGSTGARRTQNGPHPHGSLLRTTASASSAPIRHEIFFTSRVALATALVPVPHPR